MGLADKTCPTCGRDQNGFKNDCPDPKHYAWPNEPQSEAEQLQAQVALLTAYLDITDPFWRNRIGKALA